MQPPKKYQADKIESKWSQHWLANNSYSYDPSVAREQTYVIDTPPPTVSGSLHMGHVFSYTQTDIIARFKRMQGFNVFYPIGWDNNGLPTERRVQKLFGITCDPSQPYDPNLQLTPASKKQKAYKPISRQNFIEACRQQTAQDQDKYRQLWQSMGLSFDWQQEYSTISNHCLATSQLSFLQLAEQGEAYAREQPVMWDVTFQTAVALAEVEEHEAQGHYHDIRFQVKGKDESFTISTTRPELLPACVAIVAHPEDKRYSHLWQEEAITPLFGHTVPIMPAEHADPEKGTGILMVCTFGDSNDVAFWQQSKLPLKQIIDRKGHLVPLDFSQAPFASIDPATANSYYQQLSGQYTKKARKIIAELLAQSGHLVGEPTPTTQAVKFYEKGELPLEYITTRQWFIRLLAHKQELLEQGRKVSWRPESMVKRYKMWVEGLNQDWCISRQRFFGVPFPVWYPLDDSGEPCYQQAIFAKADQLPIDPQQTTPPGYTEPQRGQPGGFTGDPDVMDTWATSSLSPQINSHWAHNSERHNRLYPADLRPQAHEIIRTWAFYTLVKSYLHAGKAPWHQIAISGWVVNPDRSKMSKSKGQTVTPEQLLADYSADALRYWAGRARLGHDTIFADNVFKIGQKLVTKLFNASKFVLMQLNPPEDNPQLELGLLEQITEPLDQAWQTQVRDLITTTTSCLQELDYAGALAATEKLFWQFCDDYIELVKVRAYQYKSSSSGQSAVASLSWTLNIILRLLAPFMPFITEEIWSWHFADQCQIPSIHQANWPDSDTISAYTNDQGTLIDDLSTILEQIRTAKSQAQQSMKAPIKQMTITMPGYRLPHLQSSALFDIAAASQCEQSAIDFSYGDQIAVAVELEAK